MIAGNIANSPGAIAARYELAYQRSGWAPAGLPLSDTLRQALPNPDALTASDGHAYRRDAQGHWSGEGGIAAGNVALELETTRRLLQPALAEHAQVVAAIAQSPPSPQDQQREETLYRYRITGTELKPDWQQAIELATQRTRAAHGLTGDGAMKLQRGTGGTFGADSPIAHLQRDADGVDRVAAVTSSEDIRQALREVQMRGQGLATDAERALPQVAAQPLQPNAQQVAPHAAPEIATLATVNVRAPEIDNVPVPAIPAVGPSVAPPALGTDNGLPITAGVAASLAPSDQGHLQPGDRGAEVQALQASLIQLGINERIKTPVVINVTYDQRTASAQRVSAAEAMEAEIAVFKSAVALDSSNGHALQAFYDHREQKDANEYSDMLGHTTARSHTSCKKATCRTLRQTSAAHRCCRRSGK
ncbi:hypothetical protein K6979_05815 [Xanthomonas cucurbitae]|nr:hypothetical protein K6980_05810 [Xanthomonas cucurbitae]WDM83898.1 hypothetical protein K6979_05815 [Xanthomonas cucurbitae]